jgi:hypothetical protein
MTLRPLGPHVALLLAAMPFAESARSGVWTTDPVLGLAAEYSSNPSLLYVDHSAEIHGAVLLDAPTAYHADDVTFTVLPSFRVSNNSGYSNLASDYAHLTAAGELDSERNTLTLSGEVGRDSSLYYNYELNGSTGVRRDTTTVDFNWARALTELVKLNLDINSSRVIYGQSTSFTTLTDYHYTTAIPSMSWKTSERTTVTLSGTAGLYNASDEVTKSSNSSLQIGLAHQLSELWTVTASAGYSRENNDISEDVLVGYEITDGGLVPVIQLESFKSTDTGSVYDLSISRHGQLLSITADANRSVVPTGFAFLSRQSSYQISFAYPSSARWTFDGHARRLTDTLPQAFAATQQQSFWDLGLSAAWQMTEKWTLTLRATRLSAKYTPPVVEVGATGFDIQLSRHFNRIEWH